MNKNSNLPPGITDYDIEKQANGIDILSENERQTLKLILPALEYGFKSHAEELLENRDPTGGLVLIKDQVNMLNDIVRENDE